MSYSRLGVYLGALCLVLMVGLSLALARVAPPTAPISETHILADVQSVESPTASRAAEALTTRAGRVSTPAVKPEDGEQRLMIGGQLAYGLAEVESQTWVSLGERYEPQPPAPKAIAAMEHKEEATPTPAAKAATEQPKPPAETRKLTFEEEFIERVAKGAQQSQRETGVPASVALAQAILESDWGRSSLAKQANNLFGIKAHSGPGTAGVVWMKTWEATSRGNITVNAPFRAYISVADSIKDHGLFLSMNARYQKAMDNCNDPKAFARLIHQAGYATDPAYASKLIRIMDRYNLYQYDVGRDEGKTNQDKPVHYKAVENEVQDIQNEQAEDGAKLTARIPRLVGLNTLVELAVEGTQRG